MSYFKPQSSDGKKIIISSSNFEEEIKVCENLLVGYFVGWRPSFSAIEAAVKKEWNPKGIDSEEFLFESEETLYETLMLLDRWNFFYGEGEVKVYNELQAQLEFVNL